MLKLKNIDEFEKWVLETDYIYLYGAGKICKKILNKMERLGCIHKVKNIVVTEIKENDDKLYNIRVVKFDERELNKNIPILIAVSSIYKQEIVLKLKKMKCDNYIVLENEVERRLDDNVEFKRLKIQEMIEQIIDYSKKSNCSENMKDILLLSPPYWDVYSPFSAVPCLVAKLKKEGFSVEQYDIGIHCIHQLINHNRKETAEYCMSREFYEKQVMIYEKNTYSTYEEYKKDICFLDSDYFNVEDIKQKYVKFNAVQKRVVDAFYEMIYVKDITSIDFDNCDSIIRTVEEADSQTLLETLCNSDLKKIFQSIPPVVGISVTSTCQFIPGCILAKLLKACKSDVKIIFGGSCADLYVKSLYSRKKDILEYFDYIIIGEGETALTGLLNYLKGKGNFDNIPNLAFIESDTEVSFSNQIVENVNELPVPDYDGLDIELYLAPELVLPYQTSRGCHYGHCAFCNHDEKYRHNYRSKQMNVVIDELLYLSKKYNVRYFQFVDEAIRPDYFRLMIDEMDKHEEFKEMKWIFYSRVSRQYDEELMNRARKNGCEMVMFGVESFNQRLLNFIKKGINADVSRYCLELFHKCGIKTYAWLMCNLPSETVEEAREDIEEVKKMKKYIDAFSVGPFFLARNTDMYDEQEKYNIVSIDSEDLTRFQSHKDGIMIDKEEMLKFYRDEYAKYQMQTFFRGNRYTLFFE